MPSGVALPGQPSTFAALRAMQGIILSDCLVGGVSPFAPLTAADVARYGVNNAVFVGRPKDFADAYLPQCLIWLPAQHEAVAQVGPGGRASAWIEASVLALADMRMDWYAAEQQILAIADALWPALLRQERLGGAVATVIASEARTGSGFGYEQIAGAQYRRFEARWRARQEWTVAGGRQL